MKKRIEIVLEGDPKEVELISETLKQISYEKEVIFFLEKTIPEIDKLAEVWVDLGKGVEVGVENRRKEKWVKKQKKFWKEQDIEI